MLLNNYFILFYNMEKNIKYPIEDPIEDVYINKYPKYPIKDDYINKYIKYKKKYLHLKQLIKLNQLGGTNLIQIKSSLRDYFFRQINKAPFDYNVNVPDPIKIIQYANTPYSSRQSEYPDGIGTYYSSDYTHLFYPSFVDHSQLSGISNNKYWESNTGFNIFAINSEIKPAEAIRAWFNGPTITECAGVIQAVYYMYILNKYGDELFNKRFGKPVGQFIITNNLFAPLEKVDKKITNSGIPMGNPLFFLFDLIKGPTDNPTLSDVQPGDVIFIQGVEKYNNKHLDGAAGGWNLICVSNPKQDKKSKSDKKFIGFGPNEFISGPLTIEQLHELFITEYNKPQSSITKERIEKFTSPSYIVTPDNPMTIQNKTVSEIAKKLSLDIVKSSHPIVGLKMILRLSEGKLDSYMRTDPITWENKPLPILQANLDKLNPIPIINVIPFSSENANKNFDNYVTDNSKKVEILDFVKRFALEVASTNNSFPRGCILTGTPGIGKTHLSVGTAKFVSQYNKRVLYVDSAYFSEQYQQSMSLIKSNPDPSKLSSDVSSILKIEDLLKDVDLIILDDINSEFGAGSHFLKDAMKYIYEFNKSIMISSNVPIKRLYEYIPNYIGYDEQFADNFIVKYFDMESFRKQWIENSIGLDKLNMLATYSGDNAAGIVIEDTQPVNPSDSIPDRKSVQYKIFFDDRNLNIRKLLQKYSILFMGKTNMTDIRINLIEPAMKCSITNTGFYSFVVDNLFLHSIEKFNIGIIYVSEQSSNSIKQLLHLVVKAHDKQMKIIIITDSIDYLKTELARKINNPLESENKQRLTDRVKIVLPQLLA